MRRRLAVMMFLQYAVLGVWAVTLPTYLMAAPHLGGLGFSGQQVSAIYSMFAVAALATPFVAGLLADRFFASQRLYAALHFVGGVSLAACFLVSIRGQSEIRFEFDKASMNEEQYGDLWRQVWERQSIAQYLKDPAGYKDRSSRVNWLDETLVRLGIVKTPRLGDVRHAEVWSSQETAMVRLGELDSDIAGRAATIGASPEVKSRIDRVWAQLLAMQLFHCLAYMPTFGLSNSISFRNLLEAAQHYGHVRVFGTLGWLAAGLFVGIFLSPVSALPMLLGAGLSAALALYCVTLPHTPPAHEGKTIGELLGLPALQMFARRGFRTFAITCVACTLLAAFHNIYLNRYLVDLGVKHAAAWQTLSNVMEIGCILAIPYLKIRFGLKRVMLIGLLACAIRFAIYATANIPWILAVGIPLQGVFYSLCFVSAVMFVDRQAPRHLRASTQGLMTLLNAGIGSFLGNWASGAAVDRFRTSSGIDWPVVWLIPAFGSLAAALYFAGRFREPALEAEPVMISA